MTGQQLGKLVNMSQSKISRIESGATPVTPRDADRLARALGASPDLVAGLIERAERAQNKVTDMRTASGSISIMQRSVARNEKDVREFRIFQNDLVMGLAQTGEYARAVLTAAQDIREAVHPESEAATVSDALAARVQRQAILADPARRFHLLLTESVLGNAVGGPDTMLGQLGRLRTLAEQPNVTLKVIPSDAPWTLPFVHGFELLDAGSVLIDIYNTSIVATGDQDVALYRYVFDRLDKSATAEVGPILSRYRRRYLEQAG
jgi:transcriptional regulator with XRE-family HTH domain